MSSTPHSPPETPSKPAMAVDTENATVKVRSPETPLNATFSLPLQGTQVKQSQASQVQVPSTLPQYVQEDRAILQDAPQANQLGSESSQNSTDATEGNHDTDTEGTEADIDAEVIDKDWDDFEDRYRVAIDQANNKETQLMDEFEKHFEVFRVWSLASSCRDTNRGWKRLVTQQQFVVLEEAKLKEKKAHYEEVVQAFKRALDMLK